MQAEREQELQTEAAVVQHRHERAAARRYVAERRALTVPESPYDTSTSCHTRVFSLTHGHSALLTKARGEIHAERFEALVQEEERAAEAEAAAQRFTVAPLGEPAPRAKPRPALTSKAVDVTLKFINGFQFRNPRFC